MTTAQFTRKLQGLYASLDKATARRDKAIAQYRQALIGYYVRDVDVTLNGVFYEVLRPAESVYDKKPHCMSIHGQYFKRTPNTVGEYRSTGNLNARIVKRLADLEWRISDKDYDVQCLRGEIERLKRPLISLWQ